MSITIKEVKTKCELKQFINFIYKLYKGNEFWSPQLRTDEWKVLSKSKNPAFEYCTSRYWLAYKDGKIVGRIAGIINNKSNEKWKEKKVRFGWIDFIDDIDVCKALLDTVENWAKELGMDGVHGPLGFTDMDNEGMIVKGFEELSTLASIYNYPYYPVYLEKLGYLKDVDWVQYEFKIPDKPIEKVEKFAEIVKERYDLRVLEVKKAKELKPYAVQMFHVLNEAFSHLYGFTALNDIQIQQYIDQYFGFINPDLICLVLDKEDRVVGFGISMPSLTKAMQKCNGKLFPFGFIYLLRSLKKFNRIDMYLNGVLPEYHGKGVHSIYYDYLNRSYIKHKVKLAVTNPQLEENAKALNVWKYYDGRQHITRRCYVKHMNNA